ncbi:HEAT repeat domain-containing protein [Fontisphaera persica]|uniref:HEAT repeat domain-containing protein n=1 Tax=Fontisphaera persica TaxID=2974023 RepID=UPI0024C04F9C|nr:HEAT repeat domain-containing protein [Fontisphaera persica]WCJ59230.1 HEAT repeat domain-containing protein [Fontisphaera persica]
MNTTCCSLVILLAALAWPLASAPAASTPSESELIAVLQSPAPPEQKDAACARLKRIGTAAAVPALARLLTDPELSHSARYALESLPCPEATAALLAALADAQRAQKAGILQSLGERPDMPVAPVARHLNDSHPDIIIAAAIALGKRGGAEAITHLQPWLDKTSGPIRTAIVDALLRAAENLQGGPHAAAGLKVYERLTAPQESPAVRQAAWCGLLRADKKRRLSLMREGLLGTDAIQQRAVLQVAAEWNTPAVAQELGRLLPKLPPPVQASVIEILRATEARSAVRAVVEALRSPESYVRIAAVNALAELGQAAHAPSLLQAALSQDAQEQKAARRALARLRDPLAPTLLKLLPTAAPAMQAEIIQTLAVRQETEAVPQLLQLARTGPDNVRTPALRAVGQLAKPAQLAALVQALQQAPDDAQRRAAQEALLEACRRLQARPDFSPEPLVAGLQGEAAARAALYPVLAQLRHERVRAALLAGRQDADAQARQAALRALCDSVDPGVLPALLELARSSPENTLRVLAVRGAARLVHEEAGNLGTTERAALLRDLLGLASRVEEKRMILGRLAAAPTVESLALAASMTADPALQNEAAQAVSALAESLAGAHPAECTRALQTALKQVSEPARQKDLQARLQHIEALADYLTVWQMAGPYQQAGKSYQELFDLVFPPETATAEVKWKPLPAGTDPKRPFVLDVLKALGGEQRVAYLRTRVYSETEQPARLEFGSDDGVKIWLNGRQVAALNVARPLTPGSDKTDVVLQPGWNTLLVKLTQNNLGWEFCARFLKPDGTRLAGLKYQLPE